MIPVTVNEAWPALDGKYVRPDGRNGHVPTFVPLNAVVHEPGDAPGLLVRAEPACVRPHGRLDGEHVLAKRVGLGPFAHELPGLVACGHARSLVAVL